MYYNRRLLTYYSRKKTSARELLKNNRAYWQTLWNAFSFDEKNYTNYSFVQYNDCRSPPVYFTVCKLTLLFYSLRKARTNSDYLHWIDQVCLSQWIEQHFLLHYNSGNITSQNAVRKKTHDNYAIVYIILFNIDFFLNHSHVATNTLSLRDQPQVSKDYNLKQKRGPKLSCRINTQGS